MLKTRAECAPALIVVAMGRKPAINTGSWTSFTRTCAAAREDIPPFSASGVKGFLQSFGCASPIARHDFHQLTGIDPHTDLSGRFEGCHILARDDGVDHAFINRLNGGFV